MPPAGKQADVPDAAGGDGDVPVISSRTYTNESVKAKVTGFFEVDGGQDLNKPASITDDGHTWIQYGRFRGAGTERPVHGQRRHGRERGEH